MKNDTPNTLPTIETQLDAPQIKDRLTKLSKRGKLPGFDGNENACLASVAAHGMPFDSKLIIQLQDGRVLFDLQMLSMMPRIFAFLLVITIWPGLPLTDGFLSSFTWYSDFEANTGVKTWYWYLPLTVLPAPFAWKSALRKSRTSAHESAIETIEKLSNELV